MLEVRQLDGLYAIAEAFGRVLEVRQLDGLYAIAEAFGRAMCWK